MKNKIALMLVAALVCLLPAAAQTLADRARELRKEKRTPSTNEKVYTNETMHLRPAPSISDTDGKNGKKAAAEETDTDEKQATPDEEKAKLAADYKDKIEKAKSELATLQRELEINQRENRLRVAQFYSDAGNKLRNEKAFADEQAKNQAELTEKQKKIADTQASLEKLRSEARRAGIPAGLIP